MANTQIDLDKQAQDGSLSGAAGDAKVAANTLSTSKIKNEAVAGSEPELMLANGTTGVWTGEPTSGDVKISNAGALTIQALAVTNGKIANQTILPTKASMLDSVIWVGDTATGGGIAVTTSSTGSILADDVNGLTYKALSIVNGDIAANTIVTTNGSSKLAASATFLTTDAANAASTTFSITSGVRYRYASGQTFTNAQDIITKEYVDSVATGISWKASVHTIRMVSNILTAPPGTPKVGDSYIVAATATGAWLGLEDRLVVWTGTLWLDVEGQVSMAGDRYLVSDGGDTTADNHGPTPAGAFAGKAGQIAISDGASPPAFTFYVPLDADATIVDSHTTVGPNDAQGFVYDLTNLQWLQFTGVGQIVAGQALSKTGQTLDVNYTAGRGVTVVSDALEVASANLAGSGLQAGASTWILKMGPLTEDWSQTGAFDIVLNNAASELKIREVGGGAFYAILDAGAHTSDGTYILGGGQGLSSTLWHNNNDAALLHSTTDNFTAGTLTLDTGTTLTLAGASTLNLQSLTAVLQFREAVNMTASSTELNILDGATITTAQLNNVGTQVVRENINTNSPNASNGVRKYFTLLNDPINNSDVIYVNGLLQDRNTVSTANVAGNPIGDFTRGSATILSVDDTSNINVGDVLTHAGAMALGVVASKTANSITLEAIWDGAAAADGTQTLQVITIGDDYAIKLNTTNGSASLAFFTAPQSDDKLRANYRY
jgi:hypothetical protein